MFSSSVSGGSVCFRCQLRAVTRRAIPSVAAAQIRGRGRQYASEASRTDPHEDDLETILRNQRHDESRQRQQSNPAWAQNDQEEPQRFPNRAARESRTKRQNIHRHTDGGPCPAEPTTGEPTAWKQGQETGRARPEAIAVDEGLATSSTERLSASALEGGMEKSFEGRPLVRRTYKSKGKGQKYTEDAPKERKRIYRRGSTTLEADASTLDVNALGKPAEVIVLRDRGTWKKKTLPVLESPEDPAHDSLEIEAFLQKDERLGVEDYLHYLNGLKPEQKTLSAREFKSLYNSLLASFTSLQLEYYVEWYRKGQPPFAKKEEEILDEDYLIDEDIVDTEDLTINEDATASDHLAEVEDIVETEEVMANEDAAVNEDVAANEDKTPPSSLFDKPVEYPWMLEASHWSPEVAGAVEQTEHPLRGYILKSMRPKQRLAMQLMRECWGVSVQELQNGNGRLDVRVRDLEFKLLTLGNHRWLQKISRLFLKSGKQIEVIRSQNIIRIVAPKVVAETCANALNETLEMIKTKSFKLDQVPMKNLDAGILAELGKITNSVVEFGDSHEEICVSWIHIRDDEAEPNLEDLGDVIFRLLLTGHTSASTSNTLTIYPEVEDKGRFIEDFSDKSKLSWINRRREWARLCLPLTPGNQRTATAWPLSTETLKYKVRLSAQDLTLPTSTLKPKIDAYYNEFDFPRPLEGEPLAIPKPRNEQPEEQRTEQESEDLQGLKPTKPTSSGWMPFKVSTNAVFGHILHEHSPSLVQALGQPTTALANWPRALSPLIPPIAGMDLPGWVPYKQPIDATSTILMRFVPYAESASATPEDQAATTTTATTTTATTPNAPQLELRLNASDRHVLGAHSLRAISHTSISDILLPGEHVDVRSTQRLYAELPGHAIDATDGMAPLLTFLRDSRLKPGRGQLVTPSRLRDLGLPVWLVRAPQQGRRGGAGPPPSSGVSDTPAENALVPTSYVFAGLEVHRSLETTYDGWKLVYTSIEAGHGGGRRAELSLEAVPGYDEGLRRTKAEVNTTFFLRSMYQLARGLKGHVKEGPDGEEMRTSISWVDQEWSGT